MINIPNQFLKSQGFVKLKMKSKIPITTGWQKNLCSYSMIIEHVKQGWNYGIKSGIDNMIIIDIDHPNGGAILKILPSTFTVNSSKDRYHLFYTCPDIAILHDAYKIKNKTIISYNTIKVADFMVGEGAFVVGANSIHPTTLKAYKILHDKPILSISVEKLIEALDSHNFKIKANLTQKKGKINNSFMPEVAPQPTFIDKKFKEYFHNEVIALLDAHGSAYEMLDNQTISMAHPIHGSENGFNLSIDFNKCCWYCFRCSVGGALKSLKYMLEDKKDCIESAQVIEDQNNKRMITEMDIAAQFVREYYQNFFFCCDIKKWLIWSDKWTYDEKNQMQEIVKKFLTQIRQNCVEKKDFSKIIRLCSYSGVNAIKKLATSDVLCTTLLKDWDTDIYKLNVNNGFIDLNNGKFSPYTREYKGLTRSSLNFIEGQHCPNWLDFLNIIFCKDTQIIDLVQKILGYTLTGDISEQLIFILLGDGKNGKSTFIETIYDILDVYSVPLEKNLLLGSIDSSPSFKACLKDKRLAVYSETSTNIPLKEDEIKKYTSKTKMIAKKLYENPIEFFATFHLFIDTNHKPSISGTDAGIWRRIMVIPFNYVFDEDEKIPNFKEDYLAQESSGILEWMIEGYKKYRQEGLVMPSNMVDIHTEYMRESDIYQDFIENNLTFHADHELTVSDLKLICKNNKIDYTGVQYKLENFYKIKKTKATKTHNRSKWVFIGIKRQTDLLYI